MKVLEVDCCQTSGRPERRKHQILPVLFGTCVSAEKWILHLTLIDHVGKCADQTLRFVFPSFTRNSTSAILKEVEQYSRYHSAGNYHAPGVSLFGTEKVQNWINFHLFSSFSATSDICCFLSRNGLLNCGILSILYAQKEGWRQEEFLSNTALNCFLFTRSPNSNIFILPCFGSSKEVQNCPKGLIKIHKSKFPWRPIRQLTRKGNVNRNKVLCSGNLTANDFCLSETGVMKSTTSDLALVTENEAAAMSAFCKEKLWSNPEQE